MNAIVGSLKNKSSSFLCYFSCHVILLDISNAQNQNFPVNLQLERHGLSKNPNNLKFVISKIVNSLKTRHRLNVLSQRREILKTPWIDNIE